MGLFVLAKLWVCGWSRWRCLGSRSCHDTWETDLNGNVPLGLRKVAEGIAVSSRGGDATCLRLAQGSYVR